MCGLIAGSGEVQAKYLMALGCLSEARGKDSAGIAWYLNGKPQIRKVAQAPLIAFTTTLSSGFRSAAKHSSPIIGHTRQATLGAVTSENAHPFCRDEIAWAHNGIISNHRDFGEFRVDSMCLYDGIKEKNFSKYRGNVALVWLEDGKLNAFRQGNPLFRGLRHKAVYLASSQLYLEDIGCRKVRPLSEGHHYIFVNDQVISSKRIPPNQEWYTGGSTNRGAFRGSRAYDWVDQGYSGYSGCGEHPRRSHVGYRTPHVDETQQGGAPTIIEPRVAERQPLLITPVEQKHDTPPMNGSGGTYDGESEFPNDSMCTYCGVVQAQSDSNLCHVCEATKSHWQGCGD